MAKVYSTSDIGYKGSSLGIHPNLKWYLEK